MTMQTRARSPDPSSLTLPASPTAHPPLTPSVASCWFLSAITVAATRPNLVERCFVTSELNQAGVLCLRFYKNGAWKHILIDDRFPCTQLGGSLKFARSKRPHELWVAALEKAYAKLHGSYAALDGGFVDEALVDLTGGVGGERINLASEAARDLDTFWARLLRYTRAGFLLGAGSPAGSDTETSEYGIVQGHACKLLSPSLALALSPCTSSATSLPTSLPTLWLSHAYFSPLSPSPSLHICLPAAPSHCILRPPSSPSPLAAAPSPSLQIRCWQSTRKMAIASSTCATHGPLSSGMAIGQMRARYGPPGSSRDSNSARPTTCVD